MRINNITNCHKPKNFTGLKDTGKVRYKHYEEMSEQALSTYSMLEAYKDVKESRKAKLAKAMPAITSTLIATSLALTQPGKLSDKVSTGVGFLALMSGIDFIADKISKFAYKAFSKNQSDDINTRTKNKAKSAIIGTVAATTAVLGGVAALAKNKKVILNSSSKTVQFLKSEANKLTQEINNTKLAAKVEETLNPFMKRHKRAFANASVLAPVGLIFGQDVVDSALKKSLTKDLSKKSLQNYIKGKAAQRDARAHFESIDAVEI